MSETLKYWIKFYNQKYFIRFSIVDKKTSTAVGTIEGFGGDIGVLRLDICSDYEKEEYLSELLQYPKDNFKEFFGNKKLVTKAISEACERRNALTKNQWEYIDSFRDYHDYYKITL